MPATAIYRALMVVVEQRRLELGLSMASVNDIAGLQDGFYSKMIYPDTPSGRQAQWATVDLAIEALFGRGFEISISLGEMRMHSMPSIDKGKSNNALQIRHWRHRKHFQDLGAKGGIARSSALNPEQRSAAARKAAKARWRGVKKAKRQGEAHVIANAKIKLEERAT